MLGLVLLWQVAVVSLGVKEYILPTPWAAVQKLFDPNYPRPVRNRTIRQPRPGLDRTGTDAEDDGNYLRRQQTGKSDIAERCLHQRVQQQDQALTAVA